MINTQDFQNQLVAQASLLNKKQLISSQANAIMDAHQLGILEGRLKKVINSQEFEVLSLFYLTTQESFDLDSLSQSIDPQAFSVLASEYRQAHLSTLQAVGQILIMLENFPDLKNNLAIRMAKHVVHHETQQKTAIVKAIIASLTATGSPDIALAAGVTSGTVKGLSAAAESSSYELGRIRSLAGI